MANIYLIDSEKGGVGKSLFSLCLIHYFESEAIDYTLVDADPNNPDVDKIYKGITDIHFLATDEASALHSRQASKVDRIFELATKKTVLVNLPANIHDRVKYWILANDLLSDDLIKQTGIKICKWFLSNGSHNSLDLFAKSLKDYEGKLNHILVCNKGLNLDWSNVDLKPIEENHQFKAIDFPGLRATERDYLEEYKIPFAKAIQDEKLPLLSRQRIAKFIRETIEQIQKTGEFSQQIAKNQQSKPKQEKS
jgi:hypothetical protein